MARKESDRRVTATISDVTYEQMQRVLDRKNISASEFLREAVELKIRYENEDYYPLAKLEKTRLDQINGNLVVVNSTLENLIKIAELGFDSFLAVTRGDNILIDNNKEDES